MTSIYEDDAVVADVTRRALDETGSRLLQIHRFSEDESEHAKKLLKVFHPRSNAHIADVGCGVGRLAELMSEQRPDLIFTLINKSQSQLDMCPDGFRTLHGVAEYLPLKRYEVDNIMACYVLGHVKLSRFATECARVLDSHGRVFIYDLFTNWRSDCRLEKDLHYTARTMNDVMSAFEYAGFHYACGESAYVLPESIKRMMPRKDTLKNTVSVAMVFEK